MRVHRDLFLYGDYICQKNGGLKQIWGWDSAAIMKDWTRYPAEIRYICEDSAQFNRTTLGDGLDKMREEIQWNKE